ncbi:MAG: hypothetical protein ACRD4I_15890, partial [Candidatus Angelobacter sp.]
MGMYTALLRHRIALPVHIRLVGVITLSPILKKRLVFTISAAGLIIALLSSCFVLAEPTRKQKKEVADPATLIQRAAGKEVAALEEPVPYSYFETIQWSWGTETRRVIETREGRADRIVEFNDEPLGPDQLGKQIGRLQRLLIDRDARKHDLEEEHSEVQRRIGMMKAFPQAFLFQPDGKDTGGLLKFIFVPNPKFSPPNRESQVYRGMSGTVWVDPAAERLTRIEGRLTKDVSFGWGIFGKLYKGGQYEIRQEKVAPEIWRIAQLNLNLKGRVFLG